MLENNVTPLNLKYDVQQNHNYVIQAFETVYPGSIFLILLIISIMAIVSQYFRFDNKLMNEKTIFNSHRYLKLV